MTRRPELTPSNYEAVYDYYSQVPPHPRLNRFVYSIAQQLYNPDVLVSDATRKEIEFQLLMGKGALLASNHPSGHDPMVLAAAMHQLDIAQLREVRTLTKDSLFHGLIGYSTEATGAIPVFRRSSYPDVETRTFLEASHAALDLAAAELQTGRTIAILPEGTNSTPEARIDLDSRDIKLGIAQVALKATDASSFIIPIGIRYRTDNPLRKRPSRHPAVAIGPPITRYEPAAMGVKAQVFRGMQAALNRANSEIERRQYD